MNTDVKAYDEKISEVEKSLLEVQSRVKELYKGWLHEEVKDWEFQGLAGMVKLSSLFGGKDELIFVYNMGKSCTYYTL